MKILFVFMFFLLLTGCENNPGFSADSSSVVISPSSSSKLGFTIIGEYSCSSDYFGDGYFIEHPEKVPAITFKENDSCTLLINYIEGCVEVGGIYNIEENQIQVKLDFLGTMFEDNVDPETGEKYMDDQFIFTITNNEEIIVDKELYAVKAGDIFKKR